MWIVINCKLAYSKKRLVVTKEALLVVVMFVWFVCVVGLLESSLLLFSSHAAGESVELLRSQVRLGDVERFLALDKVFWTTFLEQQDGFLMKQSWVPRSQNASTLYPVVYSYVRWASYAKWKQIPAEELVQVEQQFTKALGYTANTTAIPDGDGFIPV